MKKTPHQPGDTARPRLKKETLRGLGFAELEQVQGGGGGHGGKGARRSRYCFPD